MGVVRLTEGGSTVQMRSSAADVKGCEFLGEATGADDVNMFDDVREANAIKSLKNATAVKAGMS